MRDKQEYPPLEDNFALKLLLEQWDSFKKKIHPDLYLSSLQSFFDRGLSEMEYKNTTRVDLLEVDFSFDEDNHKVKKMTAQGFPCPPSFPLTSFINFLLINLGG